MDTGECKTAQSECRKEVFGAMFPRWAAMLVIAAFVAISGTLFALALSARSEASEAKSTAACQARDIEHVMHRLDVIDAKLDRLLEK